MPSTSPLYVCNSKLPVAPRAYVKMNGKMFKYQDKNYNYKSENRLDFIHSSNIISTTVCKN